MKIRFIIIIILLLPLVFSASNESINATNQIAQAEKNLMEMQQKGIPTARVTEAYQEALQLYDSQITLEELGKRTRFDLVIENTQKIAKIKEVSSRAQDELEIFKEFYISVNQSTDLTSVSEDYNAIIQSFKDERFEDTIILIEESYKTLSDIQSSQTTFNLFYKSTTENLKNFFKTKWKIILIFIGIILAIALIFWNTFLRIRLRIRLNDLILRRNSLKSLIKALQEDYFTKKTIPTSVYHIRLKKFENMILDINRQLPLLKEDMIKLRSGGKVSMRSIKPGRIKKKTKKPLIKKSIKKTQKKSIKKKKKR